MAASDLQSDIDYMKSLAQDGQRGPLRNGVTLMAAGLIYAAASVAQYPVALNILPQSGNLSAAIWLISTFVFVIVAVTAGRRSRSAVCNAGNRAAGAAWSAVAIAIVATIATLALVGRTSEEAVHAAVSFITPAVLILYGIGWWVSASMNGGGWLRWVSLSSFAAAPLVALLADRPEQLLAYAACLILFAAVPGFILMRGEKAA